MIPAHLDADTLTAEGVIRATARVEIAGLRIGAVAKVRAYDPTTQTASVQPVLNDVYADGESTPAPVLDGVPVRFPQGGGYAITFPLANGDFVWLDFGDRSLDEWLARGGSGVTPNAPRLCDLGDAVAYAGMRPGTDPLDSDSASATDMILGQTGAAGLRMRVTAAGKVSIGTTGAEVLSLLDQVIAALQTATVSTMLGPQPLDPATQATLVTIKTALGTIKV